MRSRAAIAQLDAFYRPCGPCAMCGGPDKRHRFWDALIFSPEDDERLAWWMSTTVAHVRAVRIVRPYRRGGRLLTAAELAELVPAHIAAHEAHEAVQRPIREANRRRHWLSEGKSA